MDSQGTRLLDLTYKTWNWGVILGVRAQGVALSPNQPLNYRAQGFWPVTFGVDYTVNYPDFRVRGAMGGL